MTLIFSLALAARNPPPPPPLLIFFSFWKRFWLSQHGANSPPPPPNSNYSRRAQSKCCPSIPSPSNLKSERADFASVPVVLKLSVRVISDILLNNSTSFLFSQISCVRTKGFTFWEFLNIPLIVIFVSRGGLSHVPLTYHDHRMLRSKLSDGFFSL